MRIGSPELDRDGGDVVWSVAVDGPAGLPDRLWFRVPREHEDLLTDRVDPALIALLIPAMVEGAPLEVEGGVTDELVHGLTHGYQHVLATVIPRLRLIPIEAASPLPPGRAASGVATGFSGGVDSYAVLAEHHFSPVAPSLRLTHVTFFNVGAMNPGERGRAHFTRLHALLSPVAESFGLPLVRVDSNVDDFFPTLDYRQSYGPRNLGAAALLQRGIGRYYFAGSFSYREIGVRPSRTMGNSDPISIPLLGTRQFLPSSHGDHYTRVDKTLIVADVAQARDTLNVCTTISDDGRNCSTCPKCVRTALTLEIAGRLDEFRGAFDVDLYRSVRPEYLDRLVASNDPYSIEIRELAERVGFALPSTSASFARRGGRRLRRRWDSLVARRTLRS